MDASSVESSCESLWCPSCEAVMSDTWAVRLMRSVGRKDTLEKLCQKSPIRTSFFHHVISLHETFAQLSREMEIQIISATGLLTFRRT